MDIKNFYQIVENDTKKVYRNEIGEVIKKPPYVRVYVIWKQYFSKMDWFEFRQFVVSENKKYKLLWVNDEDDRQLTLERLKAEYPAIIDDSND